MPQGTAQGGFQGVDQPGKIGMSIGDFEHGDFHGHTQSFVQGFDLYGQITEGVQAPDFVVVDDALAQGVVEDPGVFCHDFI